MPSPENRALSILLQQVADHHRAQKPFTVFKYPGESVVKAIYQNDARLHIPSDLEHPGFIFGPFGDDMPVVLIKADNTVSASCHSDEFNSGSTAAYQEPESTGEGYRSLVARAIRAISKGKLKKVVLSRHFEVPTTKTPLEIFEQLILTYPSAFCYCWYHPEIGCWAGASPETLLQLYDNHFTTMALAGTLKKGDQSIPKWGQKEKEEQQIVTDYIAETLAGKGIQTERSAVETVEAGSLWHLRTTLTGVAAPEQVSSIIRALHPTPAVCGMPAEEARNFILENEGYSRKYYTGFLGELHAGKQGYTRLFVNLRCMEYLGHAARIFVGGGITAESDPEKEWEETRAKSQTILKVL